MKRNLVSLLLCTLVLLVGACASETPTAQPTATQVVASPTPVPPSPTPEPTVDAPDLPPESLSWLDEMAEEGNFTGAVLVAHRDTILLSKGYGMADRERNVPNGPETRYGIGSITKQFTAMAIMILEARGELAVTDPVCDLVQDCADGWEPVTIHHLLTHTAGISLALSPMEYRQILATPVAPQAWVDTLGDPALKFEPGEEWDYSGLGYNVLGYVVEQVSEQTYAAFLQDEIFTPLALKNTGYGRDVTDLAVGYRDKYSSAEAENVDISHAYAAGGMYSSSGRPFRLGTGAANRTAGAASLS